MNLLPMQYYLEVVKEKSISHAAARLHITQQTLSAHIAALEKELGCTLFRRKPDFALTYAGRVFCEYARRFDSLYRSMRQEFDDISGSCPLTVSCARISESGWWKPRTPSLFPGCSTAGST